MTSSADTCRAAAAREHDAPVQAAAQSQGTGTGPDVEQAAGRVWLGQSSAQCANPTPAVQARAADATRAAACRASDRAAG